MRGGRREVVHEGWSKREDPGGVVHEGWSKRGVFVWKYEQNGFRRKKKGVGLSSGWSLIRVVCHLDGL